MAQKEFVVDSRQLEKLSTELAVFPKEIRSAMRSSLNTGIRKSLTKIVPKYYAIDTDLLNKTYRVRDYRSYQNDYQDVRFEVAGRRLTLAHFSFSPYEIGAVPTIEVIKGRKMEASKRFGEDGKLKTPFVKHTGAKDAEKVPMNVFISTGRPSKKNPKREALKSYRSVSVPQMLGHDSVASDIQGNLLDIFDKNLFQRIEKRTGVMQENIRKA